MPACLPIHPCVHHQGDYIMVIDLDETGESLGLTKAFFRVDNVNFCCWTPDNHRWADDQLGAAPEHLRRTVPDKSIMTVHQRGIPVAAPTGLPHPDYL